MLSKDRESATKCDPQTGNRQGQICFVLVGRASLISGLHGRRPSRTAPKGRDRAFIKCSVPIMWHALAASLST